MASAPIMFNGKFLSARPTGVHRVAGELIGHIDRLLSRRASSDRRWSLVCPRDAREPLALDAIERREAGRLTWQPWEQLELPFIARGAVLVNLCNLAPLTHPRSVTLIHDAQVFLSPGSYSRAFLAWYRFALPRIGAGAARLVTISDYSRDRLAEFGVAPRAKISVIPNGADHLTGVDADTTVLARLGLTPGRYVLGAANAQAHKNVAVLFEAFADPALRGLTLVLAGADGAAAFAAGGTPPSAGAVFAGRVSDGALRALYENAACLAFPSTTEGFGLPPLEAMGLGCPAIVAPCGALPEVCADAALYAPPDEPAAWGAAIRRLADDGGLRARMIEAGRRRAALYRWEDSARRLLETIEAVADA
ncbi:MAG TPA: glycosyltransferase family 1 protein [Caulobacteraceae bacterium]|nr:glycosyltransferase family 1 protein [Caulobacteraceae bacterium]